MVLFALTIQFLDDFLDIGQDARGLLGQKGTLFPIYGFGVFYAETELAHIWGHPKYSRASCQTFDVRFFPGATKLTLFKYKAFPKRVPPLCYLCAETVQSFLPV